jgi:hypothetical protein
MTRRKYKPPTEQEIQTVYDQTKAQTRKLLEQLGQQLYLHGTGSDPVCFGHCGDLEHLNTQISDAIAFMKGEEDPLKWHER